MENTNSDDKGKLVDAITGALKQVFEDAQNEPDQYVVAYRKTSDDSLLGYHQSTFCVLTQDRLKAKRYHGDNPYSQLQIISTNVKNVIETTEEESLYDIFSPIKRDVKEKFFKGLTVEDFYLEADYLDDDTPKQSFTFKQLFSSEDFK